MRYLLYVTALTAAFAAAAYANTTGAESASAHSTAMASTAHFGLRYARWGVLALFAAGGLGGYLRRRPTGFFVVVLWYYAAYHAYASIQHGLSPLPPLLAIAISLPLGVVAKAANEEAVRDGKRHELPYHFTSASSLSFSFILITAGLIVSILSGWKAWDVIPGIGDYPFSRKLVVGMLLFTGLPLMMWIDTLAHGGLRVLRTLPTMIRIFIRCRRGRQLLAVAAACIAVWHWPFAEELSPLRWPMTVSLALTIGLLWLQPPYMLMLGASSEATGMSLSRLSNAAFPYRIVALLDRVRTGRHLSSFSWLTDDLRTVDERDWRSLVDRLVDVVPVIVLDARTDRPVVVQEAESLLHRPERLRRSTFVITADGTAPALTMNGVTPGSSEIRVLRPDQIESLLSFGNISSTQPSTAP